MTPRPKGQRTPLPREIWVLLAASFILSLGYGIVAPNIPQFAQSFDVGMAAASFIVSVFAAMRMVFAPMSGGLVTKIGERTTYVAGLAIVAASTFASAFAPSYVILLVSRGAGGIGSVMFTTAAMGLIVRCSPVHLRGRVSAYYGTSFLLGNMTGPIIGALMSGMGYRAPFLVYGCCLTVALIVAAIFMPKQIVDAESTIELPPLRFRDALQNRSYRALLGSNFGHGWTNMGVRNALVPLYAAAIPTIGAHMAGLALSAYAIGNFAMLQFAGRLVDKVGRRPMVILGLAISGVAAIPFGLLGLPWEFLALSAVAGMGASLIAPAEQAALGDIVGRDRSGGPALAGFSALGDLGSFIGPVLAGAIADRFGFGAAFGFSGVLMFGMLIPWVLAQDTMRRPTATS